MLGTGWLGGAPCWRWDILVTGHMRLHLEELGWSSIFVVVFQMGKLSPSLEGTTQPDAQELEWGRDMAQDPGCCRSPFSSRRRGG